MLNFAYLFCNISIGLYGTGTYITIYGCNVINGKSNSIEHVEILNKSFLK